MNKCQVALQEVQRSPQGATVAAHLLQMPSRNCRYFGALTYSVVITNNKLEDSQVTDLVDLIYSHIQSLINDGDVLGNNFVIQKLFSNLLLLYSKYLAAYPNPVLSFAQLLTKLSEQMPTLLRMLLPVQLELLLIFFTTLVEDSFRSNVNSAAMHRSIFEDLIPRLIELFQYLTLLRSQGHLLHDLTLHSLKCLSAWMSYIANVNAEIRYEPQHIRILKLYTFLFFEKNLNAENDEYLDEVQLCLHILGEVFETNPNLFTLDEKQAILGLLFDHASWGHSFLMEILLTDSRFEHEDLVNAFVDLALYVLQHNMIRLSKTILEPASQSILQIAMAMTDLDGASFENDQVSERMLEFWEEFINVYIDSGEVFETLFELRDDAEFKRSFEYQRSQILQQVCRIYWKKIHIPAFGVFTTVKAEFNSYRRTVADFFLVAYSFLKADLYKLLCEALLANLKEADQGNRCLEDVEATLFLLYNINDDAVYFESQANALLPFSSVIMHSSMIQQFRSLKLDDPSNKLPLSTFIQYLSSNVFYFETNEGSQYLGSVLDVIFLIIVSNDSSLSLLASKTATRICEKCSRHLIQFLPNLEVIILEMLKNYEIDGLIRLRMFNAYTVVARTCTDEVQFAEALYGMLSQVKDTAASLLRSIESSCSQVQEDYLTSLLSCVVGVAKGSSLTDDITEVMSEERSQFYRDYWHRDPMEIKSVVLSIIELFMTEAPAISDLPIIVEKCTLIVKAGFGEEFGGPFEFGQNTVIDLVQNMMSKLRNPNAVPHVFSLIECFVGVEYRTLDRSQVELLSTLVFAKNIDFLKSDPDLLKGAIDVFSKIIECKPSLIILSSFFNSTILPCAVDGLQSNEQFIIKSISKFWNNLLNLKKGSREDQDIVQGLLIDLAWGQLLTNSLVVTFLKAPRSNLDHYYSIFRSLLGKYPVKFKQWLVVIVLLLEISESIGMKERDLFINQLVLTRGRRAANDVLKAFWLKCNHLVEYNNQNF